MEKKISLIIIALFCLSISYNHENKKINLFQLGRNKDSDIIKYDLNINEKGNINLKDPINIYWVKNSKGGKTEKLSYIQNNLAYGVKIIEKTKDELKFHLAAYPKRILVIKKVKNTFLAITSVNNKKVSLKKIHVQIDGGTFLMPKVSYVKLFLNDLETNISITETIKP